MTHNNPPLDSVTFSFQFVLPEVERPQGAHDEEVARQRVLAQVVIREVQNLKGRHIIYKIFQVCEV